MSNKNTVVAQRKHNMKEAAKERRAMWNCKCKKYEAAPKAIIKSGQSELKEAEHKSGRIWIGSRLHCSADLV